jgi:hypothetical protein
VNGDSHNKQLDVQVSTPPEPPLATWLSQDLDVDLELPPLPVVGDTALLFRFWDNAEVSANPPRRGKDAPKTQPCLYLERLGDSRINSIALEELSRIFGPKNFAMVSLISDHANSNNLFAEVARHQEREISG